MTSNEKRIKVRRQRKQYGDGYDFYDVTNDKLLNMFHDIPRDFTIIIPDEGKQDEPPSATVALLTQWITEAQERIAALEDAMVDVLKWHGATERVAQPPADDGKVLVDLECKIMRVLSEADISASAHKELVAEINRIFAQARQEAGE